jgi:hypothetical protein
MLRIGITRNACIPALPVSISCFFHQQFKYSSGGSTGRLTSMNMQFRVFAAHQVAPFNHVQWQPAAAKLIFCSNVAG